MMRDVKKLYRVERTIREGRGEDSKVRAVIDGKKSVKVQEGMGDKAGQEFLEKLLCGTENFREA